MKLRDGHWIVEQAELSQMTVCAIADANESSMRHQLEVEKIQTESQQNAEMIFSISSGQFLDIRRGKQ